MKIFDHMPKLLVLLFFATIAFLFGIFVGVGLGDLNATIDFCSDGTSSRYISDDIARDNSCQ